MWSRQCASPLPRDVGAFQTGLVWIAVMGDDRRLRGGVSIKGVERVEPLAVNSFLGLRGVKTRLDFGFMYILIFIVMCNGAQTSVTDEELQAKESQAVEAVTRCL
ncbi:hypothetical protein V6N12_009842 [Hibiscus sabdariffa]|uniref:Uncharacterized protein n=1 Tax=Hibiscus sabdariffa TaxID=183260 RepID=A0ABR2EBX6_9ROSI